MGVYLVDRDLPGITRKGLAALQRAASSASEQLTAAGQAVRYLRSLFIVGEARCLCLFEAEDEAAVAAVNLAALLAYLRMCVMAVIIDGVRAQAGRARMLQKLDATAVATPEQIAMHKFECTELWRLVSRLAVTAQERTILHECFVLDLPPRMILRRYPDLFADIGAVYTAKRNLLERLRHSPELRQLDREGFVG